MQCWHLSLSAHWTISAAGPEGLDGAHAASSQQWLSPDTRPQSAEELHLLALLSWEAAGQVRVGCFVISSWVQGRSVTRSLLARDWGELQCGPWLLRPRRCCSITVCQMI